MLLNKLDQVQTEKDIDSNLVEQILQTERLKHEFAQICILGISCLNKSHIFHLKDWFKQVLRLFGDLVPVPKQESSPLSKAIKSKGLCC